MVALPQGDCVLTRGGTANSGAHAQGRAVGDRGADAGCSSYDEGLGRAPQHQERLSPPSRGRDEGAGGAGGAGGRRPLSSGAGGRPVLSLCPPRGARAPPACARASRRLFLGTRPRGLVLTQSPLKGLTSDHGLGLTSADWGSSIRI